MNNNEIQDMQNLLTNTVGGRPEYAVIGGVQYKIITEIQERAEKLKGKKGLSYLFGVNLK